MADHDGAGFDDEESDSYLASLSDLMVGMLFVFIIMLMAFALSYRSAQDEHEVLVEDLTELVSEAGRKGAILERGQALLDDHQKLRDRMLEEIRVALARRGVVATVEDNGVLRFREGLPFASGDADVEGSTLTNARVLADVLTRLLPCYTSVSASARQCPRDAKPILDGVFIEGHTDNHPINSDLYRDNWVLSTARASNTYEAMRAADPALSELRNLQGKPLFGVSGYGEERPVADNGTAEGRALNRRIDVRFLLAAPTAQQLEQIRREAGTAK